MSALFDIAPSRDVTLRVRDEHGRPSMASFVIQDTLGRVYPARSKRLAPDFFFQNQIYRADGETVRLPAGEFTVTCGRGPEYVLETRTVTIDRSAASASLEFRLRRWIDPAGQGWYSGDHHIHAAGCSHYESPTEGVRPADMMRHVLGEALSVGAVLNWGPGDHHQRQFFESKENKLSTASTLLRYDLEVSGFPSSYCGHLVLLRVRDQDYPDARQIEDWPLWDLPILKWAKAQGAVAGFVHSGFGLQVKSRELPNYEMPNFDGIGANESIMDVTHDVVDFISTADTPFVHELNIWYHTLNCGFRTRVSGETDFPCISDERVGAGRSYVHLTRALTYDAWCEGVRDGRSYVSDGFSHLIDLAANNVAVGTHDSEVRLERPGTVRATARVACLLPEKPNSEAQLGDEHAGLGQLSVFHRTTPAPDSAFTVVPEGPALYREVPPSGRAARVPLMARLLAVALLLALTAFAVRAEDWPAFRGPTGQGHSAERELPFEWSETRNVRWKTPVPGLGWSSPVVADGRVWLTTATEERGKVLRALAFDVETGRQVVNADVFRIGNAPLLNPKNSHASPTPIVEGDRVYIHFGADGTAALTTAGEVVWREQFPYESQHGNGGSPVLYGDLLIFSVDGYDTAFVVALDKRTGKVRWKTPRRRPISQAYSTPLVIRVGDRDELVSVGAFRAAAYDPQTGKEKWSVSYADGFSNVPRPVFGHGLVYIATGFQEPSLLAVRTGGSGDVTKSHVAWTLTRGAPLTPSPLLVGDELYVVSDLGILTCLDAKTGQTHWRQRLGGNYSASPVLADGRIYFLSEEGVATVIAPGQEFRTLARNVLDGATLASMAVSAGSIFIRTDGHLYRIGAQK